MNKSTPYQNNTIAVLSNVVCKSSYNLTVSEHRIVKMFLQQIKDYYEQPLDPFMSLSIHDYAYTWGLQKNDARKELQEAVLTLWRKELYEETSNGGYCFARWCDRFYFDREQDSLTIKWSDTILSHISQLKERFTKLDLLEMKDFSSSYTFRLYEILICSIGENSYKNPKFLVEDLQRIMKVPESYLQYKIFKQKVLTPCTKELQTKTGKFSKLNFVEGKLAGSKKVVSLEFSGCGVGNRYKG